MSAVSAPTQTNAAYTGEHVDVVSSKSFEATVKDLRAELSTVDTRMLMDRLSSSATWEEYEEECEALAGRSNLMEVAQLNWGRVMTLASSPMKAELFVVGNPLTAQKLLGAGGPEVALYLPTKILVFEDANGDVHVSYDTFTPIMAQYDNPDLDHVAGVIDDVLAKIAAAAVAGEG